MLNSRNQDFSTLEQKFRNLLQQNQELREEKKVNVESLERYDTEMSDLKENISEKKNQLRKYTAQLNDLEKSNK